MNSSPKNKILIIGIGNTLRSDDGVGAYVCEKIEKLNLPGTTTNIVQQLQVDMIEEMTLYDHVVLVDASTTGDTVLFEPVTEDLGQIASSSHHINASLIITLAKKLYNKNLSLYLCAIPGLNFDTGNTLMNQTENIAEEAIIRIKTWIYEL